MRRIEERSVNDDNAVRRDSPRLSDVLFGSRGFDSLAAVSSNAEAIENALLFSSGLQTLAALVGPSGWGKTHILEATAKRLREDSSYPECEVQSATDWVGSHPRYEPHVPLILDNVQDVMAKARSRFMLRLALERRARSGRPTILAFTSSRTTRAIKSLLPQPREWAVTTIAQPSAAERQLVVGKIAETEGVCVSDELIRLLAQKLRGNGLTVRGAMKRLKLHDGDWRGPEGTLRACGVLNPFFSDNSSWDLRDHIMDCARAFPIDCPEVTAQDLAMFVMLRKALLAESDIARFFEVEPAHVYNVSGGFSSKVRSCPQKEQLVRRFIERAVLRLHAE